MRTIETTLYRFEELTDEAKERAIECARRRGWGDADHIAGEFQDTLKGACKALGLTDVGRSHTRLAWSDSDVAELRGIRAWKWLVNNLDLDKSCPFTGVCYDESFLDPLREFMRKPDSSTLEEIIRWCGDSLEQAYESECEHLASDEAIADAVTANECEFLETGEMA